MHSTLGKIPFFFSTRTNGIYLFFLYPKKDVYEIYILFYALNEEMIKRRGE